MIRPWKRKPQPASPWRLLFELTTSIFYWKIQRFAPNLTFKHSPSAAPATKSDTTTSRNTAPATKSDTWTSPSTAPATKSDTWTSPNTAPDTKNDSYAWSSLHMKPHFQSAEQQVSLSNLTKYCACHAKWPLNVWQKFAENKWNVISNAGTIRDRSDHDPTMIRPWSDHENANRNPPRVTFRAHHEHFLLKNTTFRAQSYIHTFTKCCACHKKWHLNFTKYCTCHEKWRLNFTKYCTCHEKWHLNFTKYCTCHKSDIWTSPSTAPATKNDSYAWSSLHMKPHFQCAEQQVSLSNLTKYCACHAKWPLNLWQKFAENKWNVISNAGTIRDRSDHDPTMIRPWKRKPQPASPRRLLFELTTSIFYWKIQRFAPNLTFTHSPSAAPATKSDTWTSPSTAPATKSDAWTSPSTAPATKSDTWTSPSIAPATKSDIWTSPSTAPATKNDSYAWSSLHMKPHFQCAEQQVSLSNLTKYCACHAKWPLNLWQKFAENKWNVMSNAGTIRDRSDHDPTMIRPWKRKPQPASPRRLLFELTTSIFYWKIQRFAPNLTFTHSPSAAPATKSDTWTSPSTAPATKSDAWTSPSTAPATKSDTWTSPSIAPATKSDIWTSPSTAPATKSDSRTSPSTAPATKSDSRTSPSTAPVTKSDTWTSPSPDSTLLDSTTLFDSTLLDSTLLDFTLLTWLYSTWLYFTWLYDSTLFDTTLIDLTSLYSTGLYSTWLYSNWLNFTGMSFVYRKFLS